MGNKTGDMVNLDDNDNSIIDNVFSKIEGKSKKRRQSGKGLKLESEKNTESKSKNKEQFKPFNIKDLVEEDDKDMNEFNLIPKSIKNKPMNKQSLSTNAMISTKDKN